MKGGATASQLQEGSMLLSDTRAMRVNTYKGLTVDFTIAPADVDDREVLHLLYQAERYKVQTNSYTTTL